MTTIQRYLAWAEKRIGTLVIREGLCLGMVSVVQGPLTLTFRVRLLRPSPASLRKLLGMGPALAQALQAESVRVSEGAGCVYIELPSPTPQTPPAALLAQQTQQFWVAVGLDSFRRPARVDLRQHGALLWVGPSRRGKTESLKSTVYALDHAAPVRTLQYVILSQKRNDWRSFEPAAGCLGVVSDASEGEAVLAWIAQHLLPIRARDGQRRPAFLVVVDDLLNLLERVPAVAGYLAEIASMGAGLGVHLLAGTQEAGSKRGTGGPAVESNCTCRIVYRSSSAAAAARATGLKGAGVEHLSSERGDALLIVDGRATRVATGWADDRLILQLPAGDTGVAPWHGPTTSTRRPTAQPTSTGGNQLQPPLPPVLAVYEVASREGGTQPVGVVDPVDDLIDRFFPLPRRQPTPAEVRAIRTVWADFEAWAMRHGKQPSLSQLTRLVYGGKKDGARFGWVKDALATCEGEDVVSVEEVVP